MALMRGVWRRFCLTLFLLEAPESAQAGRSVRAVSNCIARKEDMLGTLQRRKERAEHIGAVLIFCFS